MIILQTRGIRLELTDFSSLHILESSAWGQEVKCYVSPVFVDISKEYFKHQKGKHKQQEV